MIPHMAWAVPKYPLSQVDKAGKALVDSNVSSEALDQAYRITNNWRASHSYPLNTFQVTLRKKANSVNRKPLVSQRIKRLESIRSKLIIFPTMQLSQMQDIGGCRAVLDSVRSAYNLVELYKKSRFGHQLVSSKDYIEYPKMEGYRGIHLIYKYAGTQKTHAYNGLRIEVQIRTSLQHIWATAVETVGIFTRQALKSSLGDKEWLRFFSLMGSVMASREKRPAVPGVPEDSVELIKELRELSNHLHVLDTLAACNATISYPTKAASRDSKYYLIKLQLAEKHLELRHFRAAQSEKANLSYIRMEREYRDDANTQVVLVSVDSLAALRRAYPNYFLDTGQFMKIVKDATI